MGSNSSSQPVYMTQQERILIASRNYHIRIRNYNPLFHGLYVDYVEWCHGQFQLECIPEECRYGPNYIPNRYGYDDYVTPT